MLVVAWVDAWRMVARAAHVPVPVQAANDPDVLTWHKLVALEESMSGRDKVESEKMCVGRCFGVSCACPVAPCRVVAFSTCVGVVVFVVLLLLT